jgi:hypothetical protein
MALPFRIPQPRTDVPWVTSDGRLALPVAQYMPQLDALVRQMASAQTGALTVVHTPNNANAAAAGVPIGGLYVSGANPAQVYIRTA